ncbi:DoxX family membrane protein [Streptomyces sp. DH37]|uniref:DoxX family membrane protein n=1 Tax=Streptomyces sp. DH37 TaxID=3040122 RepID=UPI002441673D|nr:DoxX family membrane protein [Streptomyces sp. DH37]MDG9705705.1 DoxX family membrane protein [Streptomyces sp. DH37]
MAVHGHSHGHRGFHLPVRRTTRTAPASGETAAGAAVVPAAPTAARVLAGARVLTGFVFLWAFLDKTFGLDYATPAERAWTEGGSPTEGFLSGVAVGPLESVFHDIAGAAWADWLFMLGLLGIGLALTAGVALRLAAAAGTVMMALMWAAEWPLAQHLSDGSPSMSTNPVVDYHVVYAVVLIALAVTAAGDTWGLGRRWARLSPVRRLPWLR